MRTLLESLASTPSPASPHGRLGDLDRVGDAALEAAAWIREQDPHALHALLTRIGGERPAALADIAMALAALVDPDEEDEERAARVEAISAPRVRLVGRRYGGAA
ncbi:hypothetical protein [Tomitella gaofuii]|uniref:hypothetical protein n=1 Tax=Tomitella gaofuii TaxID=2760083 RepID=UPI0015F85289|nr:hypothetical protein [Tomitella gaofuii]